MIRHYVVRNNHDSWLTLTLARNVFFMMAHSVPAITPAIVGTCDKELTHCCSRQEAATRRRPRPRSLARRTDGRTDGRSRAKTRVRKEGRKKGGEEAFRAEHSLRVIKSEAAGRKEGND